MSHNFLSEGAWLNRIFNKVQDKFCVSSLLSKGTKKKKKTLEHRYFYKYLITLSCMQIISVDVLLNKEEGLKDKRFRRAIRLFVPEFGKAKDSLEQILSTSLQFQIAFERVSNQGIYGVALQLSLNDPVQLSPEVAYAVENTVNEAIEDADVGTRVAYARDSGVKIKTRDLKSPFCWDYFLEDAPKENAVRIEIPGLPNEEARTELTRISDRAYFPSSTNKGWETRSEEGRIYSCDAHYGYNTPTIVIFKKFEGEFDAGREKELQALFEEVKSISGRHRMLQKFKDDPKAEPFRRELEKSHTDIGLEFEQSSLGVQGNYTPAAYVEFYISSKDRHIQVLGTPTYQNITQATS